MASLNCFVCSLPFPEAGARYVKGKPVCPQCQNIVGDTETSAQPAAAAPAAAPTSANQAAPRVVMPVNGGKLYFEHSGSATAAGLFLMPAAGLGMAIAAGYAYALFSSWNPFIYVNGLGAIAAGFAIAFAIGQAGKFTDSRSLKLAAGIGLLSGFVTLWWCWAVWLQSSGYAASFSLAPGSVLAGISKAAAAEAWVIKGITVSGLVIKIFWFLEALVLVGVPCFASTGMISSAPYCERCRLWLPEPVTVEKFSPILEPDSFCSRVEKGDFSVVASLVPVGTVPGSYTRLEVSSCPSCQGLNTFSAVLCTLTPSEDGKEEDSLDEDYVVDQLLINRTVIDWVKQLPAVRD